VTELAREAHEGSPPTAVETAEPPVPPIDTAEAPPMPPIGDARLEPAPDGWLYQHAPRIVGLIFWFVLPLACIASLVVGSINLATKIDRRPSGTVGTYLVTSHSCHQELCITGGTFTSTDGKVVQTNLFGSYSWRLGTTHKAIYSDNAADVIPLPGRWDPTATILGMTGALAFLTVWAWCLRRSRARST
jgi:hypothetical protein